MPLKPWRGDSQEPPALAGLQPPLCWLLTAAQLPHLGKRDEGGEEATGVNELRGQLGHQRQSFTDIQGHWQYLKIQIDQNYMRHKKGAVFL